MQIPLQITFENGLRSSEALRTRIEREAAKLERFHARITSCRVAVKGRSHRRRQGDLYAVRLELTGPGLSGLVIDRNPPADHSHEDAFVAVRDAFAAARRRLQDQHGRVTGKVKMHEEPPRRRVIPLPEPIGAMDEAEFELDSEVLADSALAYDLEARAHVS